MGSPAESQPLLLKPSPSLEARVGRLFASYGRVRHRRFGIPLVCAATLLAAATPRIWTSLGDMPAGRPLPQGVEYRNHQGAVRVTVAAPGVIRVRFSPAPQFGRDHSYAVMAGGTPAADARFTPGTDRDRLRTAGITRSEEHTSELQSQFHLVC